MFFVLSESSLADIYLKEVCGDYMRLISTYFICTSSKRVLRGYFCDTWLAVFIFHKLWIHKFFFVFCDQKVECVPKKLKLIIDIHDFIT